MKRSDFNFQIPSRLIALQPPARRSDSRLMVYTRSAHTIMHSLSRKLGEFLTEKDLVVVNDSVVIPARFYAQKVKTGGKIEGLFIRRDDQHIYAWIKGRLNEGDEIEIEGCGRLQVVAKNVKEVLFTGDIAGFVGFLQAQGQIPIPPYIVTERERSAHDMNGFDDRSRYQSVFAKDQYDTYSVAAPTASLHFDADLIRDLSARGIRFEQIALHIGPGTFAPLEVENLAEHQMHCEPVEISPAVWERLLAWKKEGGRIVAVGTTVMRALETAAIRHQAGESVERFSTQLFIQPGFQFQMVDSLLTNFHWPDSTLILLVAAFMESAKPLSQFSHRWRDVYKAAVENEYRFFSYGDALFIQP